MRGGDFGGGLAAMAGGERREGADHGADLAEAACEKSAKCDGITPTAADLQNCQAGVYGDLGCPLATAVGATFDQCITDLTNAACTSADAGTDAGADGGSALPSCDTALTFAM